MTSWSGWPEGGAPGDAVAPGGVTPGGVMPGGLMPPEWPGHAPASERLVAPPSPVAIILRVLIAVGIVVGMAQMAERPVERSVDVLLEELGRGTVSSIDFGRPQLDVTNDVASVSGTDRVEWSGTGRPGYASFTYSSVRGEFEADQYAEILDAVDSSPTPVTVTWRGDHFAVSGMTWEWTGLAALAAVLLLIAGPQPRLATKWAWFWLGFAVTPLWLVFTLLEPVPVWTDRPQPAARRRLTGGWAFLLSLALGSVVASMWPEWQDVLTG